MSFELCLLILPLTKNMKNIKILLYKRNLIDSNFISKKDKCINVFRSGDLALLDYLRKNDNDLNEDANLYDSIWYNFPYAIINGHLHIVEYYYQLGYKFDQYMVLTAVQYNQLNILKYLIEKKTPLHPYTLRYAAENGHLHIIKYFEQKGYFLQAADLIRAGEKKQKHILQYVLDQIPAWRCSTPINNAPFVSL